MVEPGKTVGQMVPMAWQSFSKMSSCKYNKLNKVKHFKKNCCCKFLVKSLSWNPTKEDHYRNVSDIAIPTSRRGVSGQQHIGAQDLSLNLVE